MSFSSFPGSLDLEPSRKREQRYNPENKLVFSETSYWNSDSSVWVLEDRAVLNYDADSREIQRLSYGLSWGDTAVYLIWESQNEYSPEGNLLKAITYNYDESGFIWGGNRLNYEYDFEDRQIAQERWRWERESQMFLPNRRTETPYNGQGVIDRYLTFSWDTELSKWKGLGIIGWSDTGSESLVHFYRGIWNPNTEDWFITNTNLTYYGPCQQEQAFSPPESELRYYPNPVQSGILSFEMPIDQSYTLELMDLQGRVVFEGQIKGPFAEVELNVTSSGVYLIRLKNETEEVLDRIVVTNP
ncbi:MAG: T9SS type A sorting domain-containing protein [Bacteroidota bacterium]